MAGYCKTTVKQRKGTHRFKLKIEIKNKKIIRCQWAESLHENYNLKERKNLKEENKFEINNN